MVAIAFGSTTSVQNEPASPEYLNSVKNSWETTQGIYAVDSLQRFTELVDSDNPSDPSRAETETAIESMTEEGVYDGVQERISTYGNWTDQTTNHSNRLTDTRLTGLQAEVVNVSIETSSQFTMQTGELTKTVDAENTRPISGVDDLLLQDNGIDREINRCSHDELAEKLFEGTASNGASRGEARIEPNTSNPNLDSSEILVTSDVTQYAESDVQDAAAYFSQKDPGSGNRSAYNDNYTVGTGSMPEISEDRNVIVHEGFWTANFENSIDTGCYMPTSLTDAPTVVERLNLNSEGSSTGRGIYTVLIPFNGQSDIAFERINSDSAIEIETVSTPSAYPNYLMGESLAQETGLTDLIK